MKKIILALLCVGQLYGMNEQKTELDSDLWGTISDDVIPFIIMDLSQSGGDLNTAVNNLKIASSLNTQLKKMIGVDYGDLGNFTKLVHIFADKFNISTEDVAAAFGTPTAHKYIEFSRYFFNAVDCPQPGTENIDNLIKDGADINFTTYFLTKSEREMVKRCRHSYRLQLLTSLEVAVNNIFQGKYGNTDKLNYLLTHGINPVIIYILRDVMDEYIVTEKDGFKLGVAFGLKHKFLKAIEALQK